MFFVVEFVRGGADFYVGIFCGWVDGHCRAKIDMASPNGTMRDPVLYRYGTSPYRPHVR